VLGPAVYHIRTGHLLISGNTTTAHYADETAILDLHEGPAIASIKLKATISKIEDSRKKWRVKINQSKSSRAGSTFALRNQTRPAVQMGNVRLPQTTKVKYLDTHLARQLTRTKHVITKRK
jgi:hypothetical protein